MRGWDSFDGFTDRLREVLNSSLPGMDAQYKLVPPGRARPDLAEIKHTRNPRLAGVLTLFYPINEIPHVVLMKRNTYPGVHSGQISFPGGQHEEFDRDMIATALREAEEEVGVDGESIEVLGSLTEVYIPPSNFLVEPVVAVKKDRPLFKADKTEVQSIIEVPFSAFFEVQNFKETKVQARDYTLKVPAYHVHNEIIWGATAMMISELTHLFR